MDGLTLLTPNTQREVCPPQAIHKIMPCWKILMSTTSAHGLPHVFDTQYPKFTRVFWVVLVLAASITFSYCLNLLFKDFRNSPTYTLVEYKMLEDDYLLPAVSICNENSFRRSKLKTLNISKYKQNQKLFEVLRSYKTYALNDALYLNRNVTNMVDRFEAGKMWPIFRRRLVIPYYDPDLAFELGHQIEDMVKGIYSFNYKDYSLADTNPLTISHNPFSLFGTCYTLKKKHTGEMGRSGKHSGLKISINLQQEDYMFEYNRILPGIKLLLHDKRDQPVFFGQKFVDISQGEVVFIGFNLKRLIRVKDCFSSFEEASQELIKKINITVEDPWEPYGEYTRTKCIYDCSRKKSKYVGNLFFPPKRDKDGFPLVEHYEAPINCVASPLVDECVTACLPECEQNNYKYTIEKSKTLKDDDGPQINIFLEDYTYELITEYMRTTSLNVFSAVGGYLGLLLGASVLTVCEWLEFIIASICYLSYYKFKEITERHPSETSKL